MGAVVKQGAPWTPTDVEQLELMMSKQIALTEILSNCDEPKRQTKRNSTAFSGSDTGQKLATATLVEWTGFVLSQLIRLQMLRINGRPGHPFFGLVFESHFWSCARLRPTSSDSLNLPPLSRLTNRSVSISSRGMASSYALRRLGHAQR
jgi:hypothetical protein